MDLITFDLNLEEGCWGGVDEAGRGPLAGPVVAACVILDKTCIEKNRDLFSKVNDSKQLTPKRRAALRPLIEEAVVDWGLEYISAEVIDKIDILRATRMAMREAVANCDVTPDVVLVDGNQSAKFAEDSPFYERCIVKGDATSLAIACASILAKEAHDDLMKQYALRYPVYRWDSNKGYGTADHLAALQTYGASPVHRKTFAPVREAIRSRNED